MASSIMRLWSLGRMTSHFSKLEAFRPHGSFQRNICASCILSSSITKQFIIHDLRDSAQATKNSDFGRVVDLDCDFDELKVNEYDTCVKTTKNKGSKKLSRKKVQFEARKIAAEKKLDEDKIELSLEEKESEEFDDAEKQNFKLSRLNNTVFRKMMLESKSKKLRIKNKRIILEGKRLIQDAISAGHKPLKIFFSKFSDLRKLNLPEGVEVTQVPYKTLSVWSDVVTSQGVMGVFKMPESNSLKVDDSAVPLTVICDNIKDPGNLGTILRIVSAVGCRALFLTTGCIDVWEPKVLRAGAGAHFHFPIQDNIKWSDLEEKIPEGTQIILAENFPFNSSEVSEEDKIQKTSQKSSTFTTSSELASSLPVYCYSSFKYNCEGAVIVLGGETYGLSESAYQFTINRNGSRVYIPMCNGIESLNSAVSLAILSYEFKRQAIDKIKEKSLEETISPNEAQTEKLQ